MNILFHFILGAIVAFVGLLFPTMLSLTTVKLSTQNNFRKALFFAAGVATVVIAQAYVAIGFSKILVNNPDYIRTLQKVGVFVFVLLSIHFFNQARIKRKATSQQKKSIGGYLNGLVLSSLNMFAIPYYFGTTSALAMNGLYEFQPVNNISFVIGAAIGTFLLLYIYALLANKILNKIQKAIEHLDSILAILTAIIAVINGVDLWA